MTVELKFLGTVQIAVDGRLVTADLDRKEIALLAYLAVEGEWVRRDKIATWFWGEQTEGEALQNLRQAIYHINRTLAGNGTRAIEIHGRQSVILSQTICQHSDIAQIEESIRQQDFERAVALYRGPFLDGLNLKREDAFEDWLSERRQHFSRLALKTVGALLEQAGKRRDNDALETWARRILAIDPFEEKAYRQLMLSLARRGDFNAALQAFAECVETLASELGVAPAAETMAVHERILLARAAPRTVLPYHAATFVGREKELAEATARLLYPARRLLTFLGPGGVGKTRLAIELARRTAPLFLHRVGYVTLDAGGHAISEEGLLRSIINGLGLPSSTEPPRRQLTDYLGPREMVLVLDNFERFVPVAAILHAVLREAPDVKIIVTSRERLDVRDETVYPVGGMEYPQGPSPAQGAADASLLSGGEIAAETYDAVALFTRVVTQLNPSFVLSANIVDVVRICQLVEGLPLAIELVAPWTLTMHCATIVAEISTEMPKFIDSERNFPERHRSLNAVFEHSWARLTPVEQRVFQQLAVIAGTISPAAAEAITGGTKLILESLVRKSMIAKPEKESYALHNLLRAFALEKLIAAGELHETRQRHLDYFHRFVESRLPEMSGAGHIVALQQLANEVANIRVAWRHGLEHATSEVLSILMDGLMRLFDARNWHVLGIEVFQEATEPLVRRNMIGLYGRLLLHEGLMHYRLGNYDAARQCAETGRRICKEQVDEEGIARSLYLLASIIYDHNRYDEAEKLLLESVGLFRQIEDWESVAECHILLGHLSALRTIFSPQGKVRYRPPRPFLHEHYWPSEQVKKGTELAISHFKEAFRVYTELGSLTGVAFCWGVIGLPYYQLHRYDAAEKAYREAVERFRQLDAAGNLGDCLNWLALVLQRQGKMEEARGYYHESLRLSLTAQAYKRLMGCLQRYSIFLWVADKEHFMPLAVNYFVAHHPNTDKRMRVVAEEWVENISDYMRQDEGEEAVEKAIDYGQQQTLANLVHSLLSK